MFNTSSFSAEDQDRLKLALSDRFGIEVSIHRLGTGYQLYVRSRSFIRFSNLVSEYLVAPMRYKLPVDPVTTSPPKEAGWWLRSRERTNLWPP